jgi:hypothetical protein
MKTWILTFGILAAATCVQAQTDSKNKVVRNTQVTAASMGKSKADVSGECYGKLVIQPQAGREVVRFLVDPIVEETVLDREFKKALKGMRSYRFDNELQALNILASHGWEVRSSMVVSTRTGDEHHHLMARPMAVMMPVSPWLEGEGNDPRQRR